MRSRVTEVGSTHTRFIDENASVASYKSSGANDVTSDLIDVSANLDRFHLGQSSLMSTAEDPSVNNDLIRQMRELGEQIEREQRGLDGCQTI